MDENQVILVDKPAGISSFSVVAKIRGFFKAEFGRKIKVGHTGTLDPFATGLLIILTGKNTKKSSDFLKLDKIYEATLKLGFTSTTGDLEGTITKFTKIEELKNSQEYPKEGSEEIQYRFVEDPLATTGANGATEPRNDEREGARPKQKDIEFVLSQFIGLVTQTPPRFSAIKINGERAYKLARKGQDFEVPSRQVEIKSIDILDYHYPELKIRCHVSSGTYIRTLAEDIGKALGTGAYLTQLRRLQIGKYSVNQARPLTDFTKNQKVLQ